MVVRELITILGFKVDDAKLKKYEDGIKTVTKTASIAGGAVLGLGGFFIKLSGDMEQTQVAFEVLLGSAEAAKKMVEDINTMGAKTPYESSDLINNAKLLLNFGVAAEDIIPTLSMLGDVGMGDAQKLNSLSLAFAQISSAGKLTGQDLLQLINAGFNPLKEMAGDSTEEYKRLRSEMEKGNITAKMVTDTFKKVTGEGGRFFNMMEKQSGTFLGMWSTAVDAVKMLAVEIGNELLPYGKDLLFEFSKWMDANKDFIKAGFVKVFTGVAMAIGYIIVAVEEVGAAFGGWQKIIKNLWKLLVLGGKLFAGIVKTLWKFRHILIMLTAALLAYNFAMKIITAGGFISWLFKLLNIQKAATAAQWLWNAAMSANPIGMIVAGVAALATGVYLLYQNWDKVVTAIKTAVAWVAKFTGFQGGKKTRSDAQAQIEAQLNKEPEKQKKPTPPKYNDSPEGFTSSLGGKENIPAYKTGTDYVPRDGLAYLHKGESVLTAERTARATQNSSSQSINIQTTVHAPMPPGSTEAQAAYIKQVAKQTVNSEWQSILRQAKAATPLAGAH